MERPPLIDHFERVIFSFMKLFASQETRRRRISSPAKLHFRDATSVSKAWGEKEKESSSNFSNARANWTDTRDNPGLVSVLKIGLIGSHGGLGMHSEIPV